MKTKKYTETDQVFEALKNLNAEQNYVHFDKIFQEFVNVRGTKLENVSKRTIDNMCGRVRRCLVLDKNTFELNKNNKAKKTTGDSQPYQLSISIRFPEYKVLSKTPISIRANGDIKNRVEVEENSYKLVKIK